jgi:Lon protease-like protein
MLTDCHNGDGRFGIVPVLPHGPPTPEPGTVGCIARVARTVTHPDGRSDIVVAGETRFSVEAYLETDRPYLVATVTPLDDGPPNDRDHLRSVAEELRKTMVTYLEAASRLTASMQRTSLPDDPSALSFAAAALLDADLPVKVRLLNLISTTERLHALVPLFARGTEAVLDAVQRQRRARGNGKRPVTRTGTDGA